LIITVLIFQPERSPINTVRKIVTLNLREETSSSGLTVKNRVNSHRQVSFNYLHVICFVFTIRGKDNEIFSVFA
ncbi:MAG: hypothetical protein LBS55_08885, partial [Prevotellaceae bacterium]|nr:hypothetical protein [Prevotellaceae bacterium]